MGPVGVCFGICSKTLGVLEGRGLYRPACLGAYGRTGALWPCES